MLCGCRTESLLNRYWDDRDTPRDRSWLEDVETAKHSGRPPNEVYRDLRAGAASGGDYSSRWLRDTGRLASIGPAHPSPSISMPACLNWRAPSPTSGR
ncbi:trehalase family glycosidase [Escherichia coli]